LFAGSAVFSTGAVHQFQAGVYRIGAICNDGSQSGATGSAHARITAASSAGCIRMEAADSAKRFL